MKKLFIILISALTSTLYFGQDATPQQTPPPTQFTITKAEGLSPFIVVKTEGKTKEYLTTGAVLPLFCSEIFPS